MKFTIPVGDVSFSEENAWMACRFLEWKPDRDDPKMGTPICDCQELEITPNDHCRQCKSEIGRIKWFD